MIVMIIDQLVFDTQISVSSFKEQLDLCAAVLLRSLFGRALPTELMAHFQE
ncbi:trehalose/maltose hydrolase-like predicted phosphorylase [Metabacillus malikii]|uniref:Trehalose/maltose hydrolase-like predicted phosphorylase n=1 Tax=Metabacillus malikii TaxID=1504265 RepID=A0ABT9ZQY0_9BACI|nr:trehalose/maltose hydrolase-like predicted phosphorylase [Metabacillus malikii]